MKLPAKINGNYIAAIILTFLVLIISFDIYTRGKVTVFFDSESEKEITYQVFYTQKNGEDFSEKYSVTHTAPAGKSSVSIELPARKIKSFRLDFGSAPGKVSISSLVLKGKKKIELRDFNKFAVAFCGEYHASDNHFYLNSNSVDPQISLLEPLNLTAKQKIDIHLFVILSLLSFLLFLKISQYLSRCKAGRQSHFSDIVFVLFFFLVLYIPASRISSAEKSEQENRMLAQYPKLMQNGRINQQFGTQFESWFNDHFRGRKELIGFYNKIKGGLAPGRGNDKVLVGKEDWLFYKQEGSLENYANATDIPPFILQRGATYIQEAQEWCNKHHKAFLYVIAPDKSKIYGEYFRYVIQARPDTCGRGQQFINHVHQTTPAQAVYLREQLLQNKDKGLLYWKNDTHWSELGAYYGYLEIMEKLQLEPLQITDWKNSHIPLGDLGKMYDNKGVDYQKITYKSPVFNRTFTREIRPAYNSASGIVEYTNPQPLHQLRLFVLRDSFSSSLGNYFAQTFSKVTMHWKSCFSAEDLTRIKNDYDIVIIENVERAVPNTFSQPFPKED